MQIGTFRRNVAKTMGTKSIKTALRMVSKNTARVQLANAIVSLASDTGRLLQTLSLYVLGLPQTQEMKEHATHMLGDIGADLAATARVLKVKLPSSTKKIKLVGTRGAALLQLNSLATDMLRTEAAGLFTSPKMTTVKKMVPNPQKGGAKEERDVDVVDAEAEGQAETERQAALKAYLSGAIDVYWRLCYDITGQPPAAVLAAKFSRMQVEHPDIAFDASEPKPKAKKAKAKAEEPVPA